MKLDRVLSEVTSHLDDIRYNYLIVPISILNIIDQDDRFIYSPFGEVKGITKVGNFMWYEVYLDILMPPDQILIYCDKSIIRDNKIDYLLNNSELMNEKIVELSQNYDTLS
jgi:hypothetical protein